MDHIDVKVHATVDADGNIKDYTVEFPDGSLECAETEEEFKQIMHGFYKRQGLPGSGEVIVVGEIDPDKPL